LVAARRAATSRWQAFRRDHRSEKGVLGVLGSTEGAYALYREFRNAVHPKGDACLPERVEDFLLSLSVEEQGRLSRADGILKGDPLKPKRARDRTPEEGPSGMVTG
jgi:hypothetical protein